jgi:toxin ParE1/3/4
MKLRWTRPATYDLLMIADHIAKENRSAAYQLTQLIWNSSQHLTIYPEIGKVGRLRGTREMKVPQTPYVIAYRLKHNEVHILTIYHTARKWPDHL